MEAFVEDYRAVPLAERDAAMLAFAERLSRTPPQAGPDDVARLREHGFDDRAILDICQVVAYFAFVNRLAEGLGVELEEAGAAGTSRDIERGASGIPPHRRT